MASRDSCQTIVGQLLDEIEWLRDKKTAPKPREVKEAGFSELTLLPPPLLTLYHSTIPPESSSCPLARCTQARIPDLDMAYPAVSRGEP